jgi:Na+-translocating ferredoxin:NAD+ oxidoreductase RnfD subunit
MDILNYVIEEALILVPVLFVLGAIIKNTPKVKDWIIPYVLLVAGIALTVALLGYSVEAIIQGVLVTGATVFSHNLIKQARDRK